MNKKCYKSYCIHRSLVFDPKWLINIHIANIHFDYNGLKRLVQYVTNTTRSLYNSASSAYSFSLFINAQCLFLQIVKIFVGRRKALGSRWLYFIISLLADILCLLFGMSLDAPHTPTRELEDQQASIGKGLSHLTA